MTKIACLRGLKSSDGFFKGGKRGFKEDKGFRGLGGLREVLLLFFSLLLLFLFSLLFSLMVFLLMLFSLLLC